MKKSLIIIISILALVVPGEAFALNTDNWEAYNDEERGYSFIFPENYFMSYEDEYTVILTNDDASVRFYDYRDDKNKDLAYFIKEVWDLNYDELPHPIAGVPSATIDFMGERNTVIGGENLLFNFVSPDYASNPLAASEYDEIVKGFILVGPEGSADTELAATPLFPDLASDHWTNPFVSFLKDRGILRGYADGRFGPNDPVTDEQIIKIVVLSGDHNVPVEDSPSWYVPFIDFMANLVGKQGRDGIKVGMPSSRAEVMAYALMAKGIILNSSFGIGGVFDDVSSTTPYGGYIEKAKELGIVSGYEGGKLFGPLNRVTRAEVAKIVFKTFFE